MTKAWSALLGLLVCHAVAQQAKPLVFDVASVHEYARGASAGSNGPDTNVPLGPGNVYSPTHGQFNTGNMPLMDLISFAYRMTSSQQQAFSDMAPAWVRDTRYDVRARTDKLDVTKDELRLMVQSLLAARFSLAVHYEQRTTAIYAMQFVKPNTPGPHMRAHVGKACSTDYAGQDGTPAADGYPTVCGGLLMLPGSTPERYRIGARDMPIEVIATSLTSWGDLGRPVVNGTGTKGSYDFTLEFRPPRSEEADSDVPTFREALRQQLGVKLEADKQPTPVLLLDHIARLSAN